MSKTIQTLDYVAQIHIIINHFFRTFNERVIIGNGK